MKIMFIMNYGVVRGQSDALPPQNDILFYVSVHRANPLLVFIVTQNQLNLLLNKQRMQNKNNRFQFCSIEFIARLGWTDDIDFDLNTELAGNSYLNKWVEAHLNQFKHFNNSMILHSIFSSDSIFSLSSLTALKQEAPSQSGADAVKKTSKSIQNAISKVVCLDIFSIISDHHHHHSPCTIFSGQWPGSSIESFVWYDQIVTK